MRRRLVLVPAIVGIVMAALTWVVGVALVDALLIGALVAALIGTPRWLGYPAEREWPSHPDPAGQRGFYDVRRLAALLDRESAADAYERLVLPRLQQVARRRLELTGETTDVLSEDVTALLAGGRSRLHAKSRAEQVEQVLDTLDEYESRRT